MSRQVLVLRYGILGHPHKVENASDIVGELGDGGGDAVKALRRDHGGGEAMQACDGFRAVTSAPGAAIFVPVPVEKVVMDLNAPVIELGDWLDASASAHLGQPQPFVGARLEAGAGMHKPPD